jgi:hypothetical protein
MNIFKKLVSLWIWLFFVVFASTASFAYDAQCRVSKSYDDAIKTISGYDRAAVFATNERGCNSVSSRTLFAKFAKFLAAETTAADAPYAGQTLYRVYGGDSAAGGASWSPVNPGSVANYRDVAGLPSGGASGFNNTGRFVIEGTLQDPASVVNVRSALPLDGNSGGILEYVIPNWQKTGAIQVNRVSGVNPQF